MQECAICFNEVFALYRLDPCLHELCANCYPKIKQCCPICRSKVTDLLQPKSSQIWKLVKQYCNGPCPMELESFLRDIKLRKHFFRFLPLCIDRNLPIELLLYCAKMSTSRFDLEFMNLALEYNTSTVKFYYGRDSCMGCLHPELDFINKNIRLPEPEKLKRLRLKYGGLDLTKTKIETTDGYILNGVQFLVNNEWWAGDKPLVGLCRIVGMHRALLAAYSIETAETKNYAKYFRQLARRVSFQWLKKHYSIKEPIFPLVNILYRIIQSEQRIDKQRLKDGFMLRCHDMDLEYTYEEILKYTLQNRSVCEEGNVIKIGYWDFIEKRVR